LVVEDELLVRKAVQHYLRAAGYQVLTASDREGALAWSEQHAGPIDLVLTDLSLSGASGPEVVEQIRSARPEISVLYMSAYPPSILARRGFDVSGGETLEKPFSKETLLRRVAQELSKPHHPA
jgi:CheY-like chemotaxis protein